LAIGCTIFSWAQDITADIELGKVNIAKTEALVLTAIVKNNGERPNINFPILPNFTKRGQNISNKPIDNQTLANTEWRVSQEYFANKTGPIRVPGFFVKVGSQNVQVIGFTANIKADDLSPEDEFKDFIDGSAYNLVAVKDDAFFAISTSKSTPSVGEGFVLTIAFYIAASNKAELDFVDINTQLDKIIRQIRPQNCWEQNQNISEVKPSALPLKIKNKSYNQYKIFQAIYYPFNAKIINIPRQPWTMIKYKTAKDRSLSNAKVEDYKTYISGPLSIRPRQLPTAVQSQNLPVGDYILEEKISDTTLQTGRSFHYSFKIKGAGSMHLLQLPKIENDSIFEYYEPTINQRQLNNTNILLQEKAFNYDIVPKFAGVFGLSNQFVLKYYNFRTNKIEELKARKVVQVLGAAMVNKSLEIAQSEIDIYNNLASTDTSIPNTSWIELSYQFTLVLVMLMLVLFIYIIWPTKNL
jgi:hypothetical protein